jgi:transcriptional regulator with XRE-family HTH domain
MTREYDDLVIERVCNNIKYYRKLKGWTVRKLAERMGVYYGTGLAYAH